MLYILAIIILVLVLGFVISWSVSVAGFGFICMIAAFINYGPLAGICAGIMAYAIYGAVIDEIKQ